MPFSGLHVFCSKVGADGDAHPFVCAPIWSETFSGAGTTANKAPAHDAWSAAPNSGSPVISASVEGGYWWASFGPSPGDPTDPATPRLLLDAQGARTIAVSSGDRARVAPAAFVGVHLALTKVGIDDGVNLAWPPTWSESFAAAATTIDEAPANTSPQPGSPVVVMGAAGGDWCASFGPSPGDPTNAATPRLRLRDGDRWPIALLRGDRVRVAPAVLSGVHVSCSTFSADHVLWPPVWAETFTGAGTTTSKAISVGPGTQAPDAGAPIVTLQSGVATGGCRRGRPRPIQRMRQRLVCGCARAQTGRSR